MDDQEILNSIPAPERAPKPVTFRVLSAEECRQRDAARGPDQLGTALVQAQAEKDAARSAVEALKAEERKAREERETEIARLHQQELQRKSDEAHALQERIHNLAAFERMNRIRRQEGQSPLTFEQFVGKCCKSG